MKTRFLALRVSGILVMVSSACGNDSPDATAAALDNALPQHTQEITQVGCGSTGQECCVIQAQGSPGSWYNRSCEYRQSYCSVPSGPSARSGTCLKCGDEGERCCGNVSNGSSYTGYVCQSGLKCDSPNTYPRPQGTCRLR